MILASYERHRNFHNGVSYRKDLKRSRFSLNCDLGNLKNNNYYLYLFLTICLNEKNLLLKIAWEGP